MMLLTAAVSRLPFKRSSYQTPSSSIGTAVEVILEEQSFPDGTYWYLPINLTEIPGKALIVNGKAKKVVHKIAFIRLCCLIENKITSQEWNQFVEQVCMALGDVALHITSQGIRGHSQQLRYHNVSLFIRTVASSTEE